MEAQTQAWVQRLQVEAVKGDLKVKVTREHHTQRVCLWAAVWQSVCGASITVRHGGWAQRQEIPALGDSEGSWLEINKTKGRREECRICCVACTDRLQEWCSPHRQPTWPWICSLLSMWHRSKPPSAWKAAIPAQRNAEVLSQKLFDLCCFWKNAAEGLYWFYTEWYRKMSYLL